MANSQYSADSAPLPPLRRRFGAPAPALFALRHARHQRTSLQAHPFPGSARDYGLVVLRGLRPGMLDEGVYRQKLRLLAPAAGL
jgi:hypothetical protein